MRVVRESEGTNQPFICQWIYNEWIYGREIIFVISGDLNKAIKCFTTAIMECKDHQKPMTVDDAEPRHSLMLAQLYANRYVRTYEQLHAARDDGLD